MASPVTLTLERENNFRLQEEFTSAPEIQAGWKQPGPVPSQSHSQHWYASVDSGRTELERVAKHNTSQAKADADGLPT